VDESEDSNVPNRRIKSRVFMMMVQLLNEKNPRSSFLIP